MSISKRPRSWFVNKLIGGGSGAESVSYRLPCHLTIIDLKIRANLQQTLYVILATFQISFYTSKQTISLDVTMVKKTKCYSEKIPPPCVRVMRIICNIHGYV